MARPGRGPSKAEVVEWVRRTTRAQGLPEKVTDPTILGRVAVLLRPSLAGLAGARQNAGSVPTELADVPSPFTQDAGEIINGQGAASILPHRHHEAAPLAILGPAPVTEAARQVIAENSQELADISPARASVLTASGLVKAPE